MQAWHATQHSAPPGLGPVTPAPPELGQTPNKLRSYPSPPTSQNPKPFLFPHSSTLTHLSQWSIVGLHPCQLSLPVHLTDTRAVLPAVPGWQAADNEGPAPPDLLTATSRHTHLTGCTCLQLTHHRLLRGGLWGFGWVVGGSGCGWTSVEGRRESRDNRLAGWLHIGCDMLPSPCYNGNIVNILQSPAHHNSCHDARLLST